MSYITFDYRCRQCGNTESRLVRRSEMDRQFCQHEHSDQLMNRLPAGTRTTFRFADPKLKE